MKPLIVLLAAFMLTLAATYILGQHANYLLAGNVAMAAMLLFTAVGHFAFINGMAQMLPTWLPAKTAWVYATGVLEIAAAVGLLLPSIRSLTAGGLLLFFVLILPGNIIAARKHLNYQTGVLDGPGPQYLWFRVPLQLLFIGWTWYFGLHLSAA